MRTIWVIEDGEYSDYHVVGVFTSRKNAELIQARVGGEIAEWPLDPGVSELSKGYRLYVGEMLRDGSVERMIEWKLSSYDITSEGPRLWKRSQMSSPRPDCLQGTVLAKHKQHAIKIFNEQRVQLIASGKWT